MITTLTCIRTLLYSWSSLILCCKPPLNKPHFQSFAISNSCQTVVLNSTQRALTDAGVKHLCLYLHSTLYKNYVSFTYFSILRSGVTKNCLGCSGSGTKPNTNPKTNTNPNPNPKLTIILTLFSCFMLFRALSHDLQTSPWVTTVCAPQQPEQFLATLTPVPISATEVFWHSGALQIWLLLLLLSDRPWNNI